MEIDPFAGEEIDTTGEVQSLYVMLALFMSEPQLFVAVIRNTFKPEDKFLVAEIAPFIKLNEIIHSNYLQLYPNFVAFLQGLIYILL